jgi:hypothetical protein
MVPPAAAAPGTTTPARIDGPGDTEGEESGTWQPPCKRQELDLFAG